MYWATVAIRLKMEDNRRGGFDTWRGVSALAERVGLAPDLLQRMRSRKVNSCYRVLDRTSWNIEKLRGLNFDVAATNLFCLRFCCVSEV